MFRKVDEALGAMEDALQASQGWMLEGPMDDEAPETRTRPAQEAARRPQEVPS